MRRSLLATLTLLVVWASGPLSLAQPVDQQTIYQARDRVMPALVHIQPVIKNYFTGELEKQAVVGSGVIFHPDGYVVTNYHVAGKAVRIICTLSDKEQVPAEYIGGDPMTDLAVIKLDLSRYSGEIHVASFGDSDALRAGQYVLAMGSPLSLSRTVSAGVISTPDRYFSADVRLPTGEPTGRYNLWIQTDAAINPGNSGGPLVDMNGDVVGINSRATFFANNLGFAIPVNVVKEVTGRILSDGEVTRSYLGFHCQAMQELEDHFGTAPNTGVLIASIDPGSPAEQAFLRGGDIVLEMNGEPVSARFVEELPGFYRSIAELPPGSEVQLKVLRDDQSYEFRLTTRELGELLGEDFEARDWGFTVKAITRQMQVDNQLRDSTGVFVVGVKRAGPADEGGMARADVIKTINDDDIRDLDHFRTLYESRATEVTDRVLLTISRGGATRYVLLKIDQESGDDHE